MSSVVLTRDRYFLYKTFGIIVLGHNNVLKF